MADEISKKTPVNSICSTLMRVLEREIVMIALVFRHDVLQEIARTRLLKLNSAVNPFNGGGSFLDDLIFIRKCHFDTRILQ